MSASSSPAISLNTTTPLTKKLDRRILHFIRKYDALREGERALGAVSGGPDSTALLLILARLRSQLSLEITVAHFNHMLRGAEETAADLQFVRSLASALDLELVHGGDDVRARARRNHESLDDAARRLRYAFLAEQAALTGATCVVTGHTMDDQAETVLLHLIRGSGLEGLAGMRPRSGWPFGPGPDLGRPLLSVRRRDTERYCRDVGIAPRTDPTNDLLVATRNQVRQLLLPALRTLNPRIEEALARLAGAAARDAGYVDDVARKQFAAIATIAPQTVSIFRRDLLAADPAVSARLLRLAFEYVTGTTADLEATHVETLLDFLTRPPGKLSLPAGVTFITNSRSLIMRRGPPEPLPRIKEAQLAVPGRTPAGAWFVVAKITPVLSYLRAMDANEAFLDIDKAGTELIVRSRRPGDRLRPFGLGGEKKLQDILVDAKVPAYERNGVPLVCGPNGIIWAAGHCIDERYALQPDSRQALHLIISPTDN